VRPDQPRGETQGGLAQLARAPALQAGGHRFDSDILHGKNQRRIIMRFRPNELEEFERKIEVRRPESQNG
jgi:hypothetical protein